MNPLAATVCVNRGMKDAEEVKKFLNPRLDQLTHPFAIKDLEKTVEHILITQTTGEEGATASRRKLRVFTDYDVDGTTGAALLTWFFRDMGFNFDVVQPDRFKDGYGLNPGAVEQAARDGVDTLITVDCGITNFEAANKAQELGVNLIIVDHHQIDPAHGLPPAFAVIDPQRADDESGRRELCGCALAFYLCMGLRTAAREMGYFEERGLAEPNLKSLLDLVVIATAADMVPLTGDNRTLVKHGLEVLRATTKPGLRTLIQNAGIEIKLVSPTNLGFSLGPRINASGRMGSAETAYRVLTTKDPIEGQKLADELESINKKRAELQNSIWDSARELINKGIEAGKYRHAVVVASADWHEGVVGIVASKVTDHFKRPAIVLAIREDGVAKGSARSYGGYNVLDALHESKQFLKGYGGHKFAAGLSLDPSDLDAFVAHYDRMIADAKPLDDSGKTLKVEGYIEPEVLTPRAIEELEKLAPYGPGNPEPIFGVKAGVSQQSVLKGRHLKLKLSGQSRGFLLEGIWFNAAERLEYTQLVEKSAQTHSPCLFAGIPELNRFMGRTTPTLRIKTASDLV
ncbi:MAG: single-stranded-DNA-specific exonuclease RecJ [Bdellovibrionales bacterium]|nr:single-stranded-DNA-specific exonuclease RecJ [Bdellovibrionales bacterium]